MFDVTARSSSSSPAPALCYSRWACRHGCHDVFSDEKFLKNMCNMKNLDEISRDICQFMDKKGACHNSTLLLKTVGRLAPFQFKGKGYLSCDPFHVITGSHWLSCRVGNSRLSARGLKTQSHCPLAASCISIWISFQRKRPKEASIDTAKKQIWSLVLVGMFLVMSSPHDVKKHSVRVAAGPRQGPTFCAFPQSFVRLSWSLLARCYWFPFSPTAIKVA